jgi:NMD protein affecting ribosome stability and mRNA decay
MLTTLRQREKREGLKLKLIQKAMARQLARAICCLG